MSNPAGTTLPPAGGMAPPAPAPDMGGGAEALTTPPPDTGGFEDEMMEEEPMEDEDVDLEAKPFGAVSPITGSDDVDVVDGVYKDNSSGVEYTVEVNYKILNPEVLENPGFKKPEEAEEEGIEPEEAEGEELNEAINHRADAMVYSTEAQRGHRRDTDAENAALREACENRIASDNSMLREVRNDIDRLVARQATARREGNMELAAACGREIRAIQEHAAREYQGYFLTDWQIEPRAIAPGAILPMM